MIYGPTPYFGLPWPSGICEDGQQVATPIGEPCYWCEEPIVDGDRGSFIYGEDGPIPWHRECALRCTVGSLGHLMKKCTCFLPAEDEAAFHDPPGLTAREAALEAWTFVQKNGFR